MDALTVASILTDALTKLTMRVDHMDRLGNLEGGAYD